MYVSSNVAVSVECDFLNFCNINRLSLDIQNIFSYTIFFKDWGWKGVMKYACCYCAGFCQLFYTQEYLSQFFWKYNINYLFRDWLIMRDKGLEIS